MATDQAFRKLALSLPAAEEKSHFGRPDFRVKNKIFSGFNERGLAYVKLKPEQQDFVCSAEASTARAIPGGWGNQGWTEIDHIKADTVLLKSLLNMAWTNVAPKTLLKLHSQKERD
jgi:hypothetical protein